KDHNDLMDLVATQPTEKQNDISKHIESIRESLLVEGGQYPTLAQCLDAADKLDNGFTHKQLLKYAKKTLDTRSLSADSLEGRFTTLNFVRSRFFVGQSNFDETAEERLQAKFEGKQSDQYLIGFDPKS